MLPPLQRTQGWGTLVVVSDKKAGPPAHPPTRPATGKVTVYFEAYKLDEVDRAVSESPMARPFSGGVCERRMIRLQRELPIM